MIGFQIMKHHKVHFAALLGLGLAGLCYGTPIESASQNATEGSSESISQGSSQSSTESISQGSSQGSTESASQNAVQELRWALELAREDLRISEAMEEQIASKL